MPNAVIKYLLIVHNGGGANNADGGGRGDIDDSEDVGGIDGALNELDAALHQAVENKVEVLQRTEEENADVFRLEDEVIYHPQLLR